MIINGCSRRSPGELAKHITNTEKNERVSLFDARGTVISECLEGELAKEFATFARMPLEDHARMALREMEALAIGTKCKLPLYHMNIDPRADEAARMTPEQWRHALETTEKTLGLTGHARFAVIHEKEGRQHMHVVWARVDSETGKTWHDGWNYAKHELAARQLERDFGHERTPGVHVEREPGPRPERTPKQYEMQQAAKHEFDLKAFRAEVRETWQRGDNAHASIAALAEQGRTVGVGKQRAFVVIDERGVVHSLSRTLGIKAPALRDYMKTVEAERLPTVEQARKALEQRVNAPTPGYDREAAQVEADKRLIDGAARAAADAPRVEQEAAQGRVNAVMAALRGDPREAWAAQQEHRVAFGYDERTGQVCAVTARQSFPLSFEQGECVIDQMNAGRMREHAERQARGEELPAFAAMQRAELPSVEMARRFAFGLEQQAEFRKTVERAFDETVRAQDGGIAFAGALAARKIDLQRDQGNRLHLVENGRATTLTQFIPDAVQERHLAGLLDPKARVPEFTSRADHQDARAAKWERIEQERAARNAAAALRNAVRQPAQAARRVVQRTAPAARAAATVARGVGGVLNSVTSALTGFGKYQEQEAEVRQPMPPPAPSPAPAPWHQAREYLNRQDAARPDEQTRSVAATHSGAVSHELQEKLRRLADEERRRERERDDDSGRERRR